MQTQHDSCSDLGSAQGRTATRLVSLGAAFVLVACGGGGDSPPPPPPPPPATTYTVGVTVPAVGAGESFAFALAGGSAIAVTQAGVSVRFAPALANGAAYTVNQTAGPRACTLSANRTGTIATANVEVTANCGTPPGGGSPLTGTLRGPIGAEVVLQNNGGDNLTATVVATTGNTDHYDETAFTFPTLLADGTAYQVSLFTQPVNQTCSVYKGATGTVPVTATALRVGCEFTYDHISRSSNDAVRGSYFESRDPVIGGSNVAVGSTANGYGEGRFVAFVSSAVGLAPGAISGHRQIYWRDNLTGETRLVSHASGGAVEGNGDSWAPSISADGLVVVFESTATNLVADDTNGVSDIFGWAASDPDTVERLSVGPNGIQANGGSYEPTVSGDGHVFAFTSVASDLTPGVSGVNTENVFRRDYDTGTNTLVSRNGAGTGVGGSRPMLSEDGNRLAFYSFASNIVAGDTNNLWDVFVYDHAAGSSARVSLTGTGAERDQGIESASRVVAPAISGDGRYVAFATTATNMVAGDTNDLQDVFVVDTQTGAVVRASVSSAGVQGDANSPSSQGERVSLSHDGTWVAFSTSASTLGALSGNVLMHNRVTGETRIVSNQGNGSVGPAVMSRNAAYVVFGANGQLDSRFASSGLFSRFTGVGRSWWWVD